MMICNKYHRLLYLCNLEALTGVRFGAKHWLRLCKLNLPEFTEPNISADGNRVNGIWRNLLQECSLQLNIKQWRQCKSNLQLFEGWNFREILISILTVSLELIQSKINVLHSCTFIPLPARMQFYQFFIPSKIFDFVPIY